MNEITLYEKCADPMAMMKSMGEAFGKSGMFGCSSVEQGAVLALACMTEKRSPFEIMRTYHIINNRLSMRADAMQAGFMAAGGQVVWKVFDAVQALATWTPPSGAPVDIAYTAEDAKVAGFLPAKPGSAWDKSPDAMLRARCISKAIRMLLPAIVAGTYTPEEVADFDPELKPVRGAVVERAPAAVQAETPPAPAAPAAETAARKPGRPRKTEPAAVQAETPPAPAAKPDEPFDAAPPAAAVPAKNPKIESVLALTAAIKEVTINNVKTATGMTPERVLAFLRAKNFCAKDKGLDSVPDLILDRILARPDAFFRDVHTAIPQA